MNEKQLLDRLKTYVGGQAEIQNMTEGYIFRGEVSEVNVKDREINIRFSWLAKGVGFPPFPTGWMKDEPRPYDIALDIYSISDISDERTGFTSSIVGETTVLFPKNGSKLDPCKVKGLEHRLR